MDLTVLNVAVPELSADLKPSGSQLLWIIELPAVEQDLALKGESAADRAPQHAPEHGRRELITQRDIEAQAASGGDSAGRAAA